MFFFSSSTSQEKIESPIFEKNSAKLQPVKNLMLMLFNVDEIIGYAMIE
jgi:hypothetical protein